MQTHGKELKKALEKRVAALEAMLKKYGWHAKDCPCYYGKPNGCECGWERARHDALR